MITATDGKQKISKVPQLMRDLPNWGVWKATPPKGNSPKPGKLPQQLNGQVAKLDTPTHWTTFDRVADRSNKMFFFPLEPSGLVGVDVDNCIDEQGRFNELATAILEQFRGVAYAEISPSGTGFKLMTQAAKLPGAACSMNGVESYEKRRAWTVTENVIEGFDEIGDGQEAVTWLCETYLMPEVKQAASTTATTTTQAATNDVHRQVMAYVAKCGPAREGDRNNAAFRLAGHLKAFGLQERDVLDYCKAWNRGNSPALDDAELAQVVASALTNGTPRAAKLMPDVSGAVERILSKTPQVAKGPWLVSGDEFCRQPSPIQWLVKKWIPRNALGMAHGPSGSGKTFLILDMALRVASGLDDWQGHKVRSGAVVFLAGEGHAGLKARATAWRQQHNVTGWNWHISQSGIGLDTVDGVLHAIEAIKALPEPPVLVVVDTVHCHMQGDENSAKDTGAMLAGCRQIMVEFGCTVLLVHHTGHAEGAQNRARGSSAWKAALDIEISVKPMGRVAIVEQQKNKDGAPAAPRAFAVQPVTIDGWVDEDGEQVTSAVAIPAEVPQVPQGKPDKLGEHKKLFQAAWFGTGAEVVGERPYISRSALLHFLVAERGLSAGTAETYVKPSRGGALIHDLTAAGIIEVTAHGWALADNNLSSSMLLQKQGAA
jgi:hypothetical protein